MLQQPSGNRRRDFVKYGGAGLISLVAGCIGGDDGNLNGGDDSAGGDSGSDDEVVMYGPVPLELAEPYDGTTEVVTAPGGQPFARFATEYNSSEHTADILYGNYTEYLREAELFSEAFTDDISDLVDHEEIVPDSILEEARRVTPDSLADRISIRKPEGRVLIYNTETVDDPPESYYDLLEPRFEDRIAASPVTMPTNLGMLERIFGDREEAEQYIVDLHEHGMTYLDGPFIGITDRVIAGEHMVAFNLTPGSGAAVRLAEDAPIDIVYPEEGSGLTVSGIAIAENAPNPQRAQQYIEFEYSMEGQEHYQEYGGGRLPIHEDLEHGNPSIREVRQDADIQPTFFTPEEYSRLDDRIDELLDL